MIVNVSLPVLAVGHGDLIPILGDVDRGEIGIIETPMIFEGKTGVIIHRRDILNSLHIEVSHLVDDGLQCLKVGEIIILNAFVAIQELSLTILCTQKTRAK